MLQNWQGGKDEKEYIIPIFVPHLGCPHQCSFAIKGKSVDKQNR